MATREQIMELWPELDWIENEDIREKTLATWALAFERSPLSLKISSTCPSLCMSRTVK